jgi:tRNA dimethylallyltransferase
LDVAESAPLLVLLGPTAVGKTDLALLWAEAVGAEIIQADSTTVYRGFDIGTAKPGAAERARVPHHLIDVADPTERFTAARFQQLGYEAVRRIRARGRIPLVVGGTGLFIRSLVDNYPFPAETDRRYVAILTRRLEAAGLPALRRQLRLMDPPSHAAIAPGDARRTLRALEVILGTGVRLPRTPGPWRPALRVGLIRGRDVLAQRIALRAARQMEAGLLGEVLAHLQTGIPPSAPAFQALGYREGALWARGLVGDREIEPLIIRRTRQYAKRQLTWFRHERDVRWLDLDATPETEVLRRLVEWTHAFTGRTPDCQS